MIFKTFEDYQAYREAKNYGERLADDAKSKARPIDPHWAKRLYRATRKIYPDYVE